MTFIFYFFLTTFIVLCFLLSFVILIQDSKTMGLGASFGGGGDSSDSLFGTSTAEVVKKFTGYLAVIFLVSCILLSLWTSGIAYSRTIKELPKIEEVR